MAQNVDWRNPWVRAIETDDKLQKEGLDCADRKHQNLQSSIFGGGYVEKEPIQVDKKNPKIAFATNADWKTQAALQHPQNTAENAAAYRKRQCELESKQVNLEQTNFDDHLPTSKFAAANREVQLVTDPPVAKGLATADDFK